MTQTVTVTQASIADLIEQRDGLLEALKQCRSSIAGFTATEGAADRLFNEIQRIHAVARAAIAKASPIAGLTEIGGRDE